MSRAGELSPDGGYYWDGQQWLSTLSPDHRWRWDGTKWAAIVSAPLPAPTEKPPATHEAAGFAAKGRELEQQVGAYLGANGYGIQYNVIREGRSGGRHEVDVLATKHDGILDFSVAVECKAWAQPIEKDVVAKFAYVCSDLGIGKAIVVSLNGWVIGAEQAAAQLGVELWGNDQLREKIGALSVNRLSEAGVGTSIRRARGLAMAVDQRVLNETLRSKSARLFGLASDQLQASALVWLPLQLIEFAFGYEGVFSSHLGSRRAMNIYEAIGGRWMNPLPQMDLPIDVDMAGPTIQAQVTADDVEGRIQKAIDRRFRASERSRRRFDGELSSMGVTSTARIRSVDVVSKEVVYLPALIGLFRSGGHQRLVAIEGHRGSSPGAINDSLTAAAGLVVPLLMG
jgi:hypothetical protein